MTDAPPARYYVATVLIDQTTKVDVVDGDTGLVVANFPSRSSTHLPAALAKQVADLLNLGEAERQRTERLKDDLLEYYSRWVENLSQESLEWEHASLIFLADAP